MTYAIRNISDQDLEIYVRYREFNEELGMYHTQLAKICIESGKDLNGLNANGLAMLQECCNSSILNGLMIIEDGVLVSNWKDEGF